MPYPYPPPGPRPWAAQAGKPLAGWGAPHPGWAAGPVRIAPEGWYTPPAWRPYDPYQTAGPGYAPEPMVAAWTAIIEPAIESVLPAIHGLLQISGQLLGQIPLAMDIPGTEPADITSGESQALSFGLGHVGLFGAADAGGPEPGSPQAGESREQA